MRAGEVIGDRFEIVRLAGTGGMGAVYRARDRANGGDVAIKVLHTRSPADAERLRRESVVLAELRSPRVVKWVGHGNTEEGLPYLAMEWLEGETLEDRFARRALTTSESLLLTRGLAEGLAALHERGIVHRDVKPSNVFLVGRELARAKLLDLGIARLPTATRKATATGTAIGTPGYMAPEQARGEKPDARVDVFALGCVLYECLTGTPAYVGEGAMAVLAKVLFEDTPRVAALRPDVPPAVDELVARMMAKSPALRPASGAAVLEEMGALPEISEDGAALPTVRAGVRAITGGERRLVSVVMTSLPNAIIDPASAPTLDSGERTVLRPKELRVIAQNHGAELEGLVGGVVVATLTSKEGGGDQASRAASLALALRRAMTGCVASIATGLGEITSRIPVGEAIDRASKLLDEPVAAGVRVDETTAGLLPGRFEVTGDAHGLVLVGHRDDLDVARTLLGRATPFVGRERELSTAMATVRQSIDESVARAVVVSGPPGSGKSRLRYEVVRGLREHCPECEVWLARGDAVARSAPFGLLAQTVRSAAGLAQDESVVVRRQKLRARVARYLRGDDATRVAHFLGELAATPFPDDADARLRTAREDAVLMGDQMRRAFEDWAQAECAARPVVLVIEDLQWGDQPSVQLVDTLLTRNAERGLLVLAFGRPEIAAAFPALWRDHDVQEMRLSPLTKRATDRLVRALAPKLEAEDVARIVERSAGNPFYVEELVRAHVEGRGASPPPTVLAMIEARLERLGDETRRVLRAASVFGGEFWTGAVTNVLGGQARTLTVEDHLHELERQELVVRHATSRYRSEGEWSFRHALVREAAEATLTEYDARTAHALAAEWLEAHGEPDARMLADHHERGGNPDRAARWWATSARAALEGNDFDAAVDRVDHALACGLVGAERGAALRVQCEAHLWRGADDEATKAGISAMEALEPGTDEWMLVAGDTALGAHRAGDHPRVAALGADLTEVLPELRAPSAASLTGAARVASRLFATGALERGDAIMAWVDTQHLRAPDEAVHGWKASARAMRAAWLGDAGAEIVALRDASLAFEAAGDERNACISLHNAGYGLTQIGDFGAAEAALARASSMACRLGLRSMVLSCKLNLGLARSRQGDFAAGVALERECVEGFEAIGSRTSAAIAHVYLGLILRNETATLDDAEREVRAGVSALSHAEAPVLGASAWACLSHVLLLRGKKAEALDAALEGKRLFDQTGGVVDGESLFRLAYAEALHAAGREDEARAAILEAKSRLDARAALIEDAKWRRSFLEDIREHAHTFECARAWA